MAPVVKRLDNTIHWINHYLTDSTVCFAITYLLYSHLSVGVVLTTFCTTGSIQQNLVSLEQPIGNFTVRVGPNLFYKSSMLQKSNNSICFNQYEHSQRKSKGQPTCCHTHPHFTCRWGRGGGMATQRLGKGEH